jgi:hypothetical protein
MFRHGRGRSSLSAMLALFVWFLVSATIGTAEDLKPKLGPAAISIQQSHDYLRTHEAPDYWALSPFYEAQETSSACSLAAIAMLVNALRGLPPSSDDPIVTQQSLLAAVKSKPWAAETREGGPGVTWNEFEQYVRRSLDAYGVAADIELLKPEDSSPTTLDHVRRLLAANEESSRDIVLVHFNQGVLTGDWDGPHISPIGSYDAAQRRVLIMDVDRRWYIPYWSTDEALLEAMRRPAPANHGVLAGERGGLIRVMLKSGVPR